MIPGLVRKEKLQKEVATATGSIPAGGVLTLVIARASFQPDIRTDAGLNAPLVTVTGAPDVEAPSIGIYNTLGIAKGYQALWEYVV